MVVGRLQGARRWVSIGSAVAGAAAVLFFVLFDVVYLVIWSPQLAFFFDAEAYWGIDLARLYELGHIGLIGVDAFRYSPIVGQVMAPFGLLPWPAFVVAWTGFAAAATAALGGRRWWLVLLLPFTLLELSAGNIHLLMAAVVAFGFRWPALWAFMALTKVTPFVGVLWFAFRGEWRHFGIAVGTTAAIALIGIVLTPALWVEWVQLLTNAARQPALGPPIGMRLAVALPILWWAARGDRRWALPIVVFLTLPTIWLHGFSILAATIALIPERGSTTLAVLGQFPCRLDRDGAMGGGRSVLSDVPALRALHDRVFGRFGPRG
jgi:hypothetical protein